MPSTFDELEFRVIALLINRPDAVRYISTEMCVSTDDARALVRSMMTVCSDNLPA